ncbi:hypothetical protein Trisim1_002728, partial [Trichoderma cf. simile WF8]
GGREGLVSYANTPMSAQQRDSPFQVASTPGPFVCLAGSAGFGRVGGADSASTGSQLVELTAHTRGFTRSEVAELDRTELPSAMRPKPTRETGMPLSVAWMDPSVEHLWSVFWRG